MPSKDRRAKVNKVPPPRKNIDAAASEAGLNASAFDKIKLAPGVIGKAGYVAAAAIIALGLVGWSLRDPLYLLILAGMVTTIFIVFIVGALWFANKHPGLSVLEGAELIQWRQLEMGQKGQGVLPNEPPVEPPTLIGNTGDE